MPDDLSPMETPSPEEHPEPPSDPPIGGTPPGDLRPSDPRLSDPPPGDPPLSDPPPGDPPPMPSYPSTPGPPPISYGYVAPATAPMTPADERTWAMLAHLSELVFTIIAPIIILAVFGKRSAFVEDQSKEALNFQLTVLIASIVSGILIVVIIGIFMLIAVGIGAVVFSIIAGIAAYNGQLYRYPVCIRFVK